MSLFFCFELVSEALIRVIWWDKTDLVLIRLQVGELMMDKTLNFTRILGISNLIKLLQI